MSQTLPIHLWSLGVGAAIGSDFFGWEVCLISGIGGTYIGFGLTTIGFLILCFCQAELSSMFPFGDGPCSFVGASYGHYGTFTVGLVEAIKAHAALASLICAVGSYISTFVETGYWDQVGIWFASLLFFFILNYFGVKSSLDLQLGITVLTVFVMIFFIFSALIHGVDFQKYALNNGWFDGGVVDFLEGLPFIIWLYVGVEGIPFAGHEIEHPKENVPKVIIYTVFTLFVIAAFMINLSASLSPGASGLVSSNSPILVGFESIYSGGFLTFISITVIVSLFASLQAFVYYNSEVLYVLASGGFFPSFLAIKHPVYGSRVVGLVVSCIFAFIVPLILFVYWDLDDVTNIFVAMTILSASASYALQLLSFMKLRTNPEMLNSIQYLPNPEHLKQLEFDKSYRAPFHHNTAIIALFVFSLSIFSIFVLAANQFSYFVGVVIWVVDFTVCMIYYWNNVQHHHQGFTKFDNEDESIHLLKDKTKYTSQKI